ncbi:hypothetical protein [Pseudomonas amygdali]|uniref:hypothetical protein n=1 Tax=Pseudomonas amygdali TaxID=47877 RepID=UPI001FB75C7E|nr:hypothetical protein [Pseudomonas amygdali]UPT38867.1 hypothetical protein LT107_09845 [Pseudomonas amygdali pv. loropetali]
MSRLSGFKYSKIVIIQSLEFDEVQTGDELLKVMAGLAYEDSSLPPVFVINCSSANSFLTELDRLIVEAESGSIPILHVECHGSMNEGLEFENSSTLDWGRLSAALVRLNVATRFNLLAVFSACYGGEFLRQMEAIAPAPCWCLVAPTEEVAVDEVMRGFREFYSKLLLENDVGAAIRAISNCRLSEGRWLTTPAEYWYEKLVIGYLETHCIKPVARARAKEIRRTLKAEGKNHSVGSLLRLLQKRNRNSLVHDYFDTYFITSQLPENFDRFINVRNRINYKVDALRDTKKYLL